MFYDTTFDVKYFDIFKELIHKKETENDNDYSLEDISDICNKLYMDEYTNVFFAQDILDDKIDIGLRSLLKIMKENKDFVCFLEEIHEKLFGYDKDLDDNNNEVNNQENQYYVFVSLFSYETFHLMHKVVCSQINSFKIFNDTITQLKEIIVKNIEKDV